MPFIVKCSNCGEVYFLDSDPQPISKLVNALESCMVCGRIFNPKEFRIVVSTADIGEEGEIV